MKPVNELHVALREGTGDLHSVLDSLPVLRVFKGQGVSSRRYTEAATALYAPHRYLEARVCAMLKETPVYCYAPRAEALADDLRQLQQPVPRVPAESRGALSDAALWGYLYLLEGSRIGSAHIARLIQRKAPEPLPTQFLDCGESDGASMSGFLISAQQQLATPALQAHAVVAARQAFCFYIESIRTGRLCTEQLSTQVLPAQELP